jgi:hypothetical protein
MSGNVASYLCIGEWAADHKPICKSFEWNPKRKCICGLVSAQEEYNFAIHQLQGIFFEAKWSGMQHSHEETIEYIIDKLDTVLSNLMTEEEYTKYMSRWMSKSR